MPYRFIFIVACLLIVGCSANREPNPVQLTLALESYASPQEVERRLGSIMLGSEVLEDTKKAPSDPRPPYHRVVIMVRGITDFNVPGSTRLTFFNERLSSVWFYPEDPEKYRKALQKRFGVDLGKSGDTRLSGGTVVRLATDYEGKSYVAFDDAVLNEEHNQWIRVNT
ncbi:hypothetical protein [Massilia genomosp. 1]|uniref:Lipoprotein n=1 Tax=Massilia genomosp. 1 TaxID=2609280 RepID=A0ABX0MNP4_9BURK|nr:hypothetical protein [Massilia genomosp. 1]NHZ62113.1 hypothetical protein [Massilia genomosp. 1]